MKNIKKVLILSIVVIGLFLQSACTNGISTAIQIHYENNRYFYEELANKTDGANGIITFTVKKENLIMTVTLPLEVKKGQMETYRSVLETSINDSDDEYYSILEKVQSDVPEAAFLLKYVDQAQNVIVEKKYK